MRKGEKFVTELCSILEKNGVFTSQETRDAKKLFGQESEDEFDDFLLQEGLVSKQDLLKALSKYYQVPSFDVIGHFFDHELVRRFPRDFLMRNEIIPLEEINDNMIYFVAANPADDNLLPLLGKYISSDIQFFVGIAEDIQEAVDEFYDASIQVTDNFDFMDEEEVDEERSLEEEKNILDHEEE